VVGARRDLDARPGQLRIWGLSFVLAGTATAIDQVAGCSRELAVGDWLCFAGRHGDEIRLLPGPGFREVGVSTDLELGGLLDALGLWPQRWQGSAAIGLQLPAACRELHRALLDPALPDSGMVRRLAGLVELTRSTAAIAPGDGFRERACRLLASHPEPAYAITMAARALALSEQAFRKRFRRAVGLPPGRWHVRRRMELAAGMLADTPVTTVAARLGYGDLGSFSRQFHRVTGVTPRSLRRQ